MQPNVLIYTYIPCTEMHEGDKVGVDGIYLASDYICLSDVLFAHIVTPPPPPPAP